jgi:hypothetical protein
LVASFSAASLILSNMTDLLSEMDKWFRSVPWPGFRKASALAIRPPLRGTYRDLFAVHEIAVTSATITLAAVELAA